MTLARFDSRRFQVDMTRPYSIRFAPKSGVRANLFFELAACGGGTADDGRVVAPVGETWKFEALEKSDAWDTPDGSWPRRYGAP